MDIMDIAERALQLKEDIDIAYEAGKKSGYTDVNLAWFNMITGNGKRITGARMFNECNLDEIVLPKPITGITMAGRMFYNMPDTTTLPPKEMIDLSSVDVATSNGSADYSVHQAFSNCGKVKYIPDYGIQAPYQYYATYATSRSLEEIELVRSNENTKYVNTFTNDTALTTIHFEGVIGTDFDIHWSPLSVASLKNIVTHLKDYSGTSSEYTYTVSFKATAFAELEAEGATAEYNGVACTWAELIDNKKWKLTKAS